MTSLEIINVVFLVVAFPTMAYVVVKMHAVEVRTRAEIAAINAWIKKKDRECGDQTQYEQGDD